jgi:ABC-type nitrate/sulfonate/bicarbonate transport system ATPase subunit
VSADFVDINDVCVEYGSGASAVRALDHAKLVFGRGDFICIVGPSGCGKTTLLQTLAGFVVPTSGEIHVEGAPVIGPGPDRGVVFQQPALFPWMTVEANAGFGPMVRRVARGERSERVEHWLKLVGLWEFRARYPYELSGGMQQRLAIVRALCNEPKLLLMDEPFGALDAQLRLLMMDQLQRLTQGRRITVVFVTHDLGEAIALADRVVIMSARPGRIRRIRDVPLPRPRDIFKLRFTAEFARLYEELWDELKDEVAKGTDN